MAKEQLMRAILIAPGQEPAIIRLPAGHGKHEEAIRDVLCLLYTSPSPRD